MPRDERARVSTTGHGVSKRGAKGGRGSHVFSLAGQADGPTPCKRRQEAATQRVAENMELVRVL